MDYNSRLLPVADKGLCGDPEMCEKERTLNIKVSNLVDLMCTSKRIVAFTGAGISTSCGIPDFRGPNGVWTKELRGEKATDTENWFEMAKPSYTHYALACLQHLGIISHTISQNVDSLHIRSGIPETSLSELHGNICKEKCTECGQEYVRDFDVGGMGLKPTGRKCSTGSCTGPLCDMAYDWDTNLPEDVFDRAERELQRADLVLVLGTSLRVIPAGNLPKLVLKARKERDSTVGKMVIVNLQRTKLDTLSNIRIFHYCDEVMRLLCQQLGIVISEVARKNHNHIDTSWYSIVPNSKIETLLQRKQQDGNFRPRAIITAAAAPRPVSPVQPKKRAFEESIEAVPPKKAARGAVDKDSKGARNIRNSQLVAKKLEEKRPSKQAVCITAHVGTISPPSMSIWEIVERYDQVHKLAEEKGFATERKG